jgi:glycosyltransferase involved in cell wall biosynthesis
MRFLIFHGYMLRGTGSNIYNANLSRALAKLGHEVHLLCQDRETKIEGVEIHNPDIHGLLPVYVKDPYEGFEVKAFPELSDEELDRYIEANVTAVREVAAQAGGIDAALANHLVMGPTILARADVAPFATKIHGSALEYTVKPNPRFLPYAREGMEAARGVLVGSRHTAESLWNALPDVRGLREKTRLGPPGVDTDAFAPRGAGGGGASCTFSRTSQRATADRRSSKKLSGTAAELNIYAHPPPAPPAESSSSAS